MSKFIIIEGPDNTGKDTQIRQIMKNFPSDVFHMFHYFNLHFKDDLKKHKEYSIQMYEEMFTIMKHAPKEINYIFNRAHLGETVYSPLYRGYLGDYVFEIENRYTEYLRQELSSIKNKLLIDIGKMGIEEVGNVIKNFIEEGSYPFTTYDNMEINLDV